MRTMAIPDFQTIMRPLLAEYADGQERSIAAARDRLAEVFELTDAEREERLPSGGAKKFANRVGWAATYLYRSGLLERPRRAVYRITPRGLAVLEDHPERVDVAVLSQFSEFAALRGRRPTGGGVVELPL